jgi:hypothetical protein
VSRELGGGAGLSATLRKGPGYGLECKRLLTTVRMVSIWKKGHARPFSVAPCERRRLAVLGTIPRVYVPKIAKRSKEFCELGFGSWVALHHRMDDLQLRHVETVSLRLLGQSCLHLIHRPAEARRRGMGGGAGADWDRSWDRPECGPRITAERVGYLSALISLALR